MKILVTGTEGYIGSVLVPLLVAHGHEVVGVDTGYYKAGWLYEDATAPHYRLLNKDIRDITLNDLDGCDAVVHMAELANDPAGELCPDVTYAINYHGSLHLARLAKQAGVSRFVYTSSCSVYGVETDAMVTETSDLNPVSVYAQCKVLVEQNVMPMATESFSPVFLRNATVFGLSPRMRFDLVLNNLSGLAWTLGEINMISDGTPWRPLVHVQDVCQAVLCALQAPRDIVHNQIFNVGDTRNNFQVRDIAEIVAEVFPHCQIRFGDRGNDARSYRVDFSKIHDQLPGFSCQWTVKAGAEQLKEMFQKLDMTYEQFMFRGFTRMRQLEYLLSTQQIDDYFFWARPSTLVHQLPTPLYPADASLVSRAG